LLIDINASYTDKTSYNTVGLTGNPYFEGTMQDPSWEGVHTVKIIAQQGTTKKYRVLESANFNIQYKNPCRTATVDTRTIDNMFTTVDDKKVQVQSYTEFTDDISRTYGNGYDKCGPRVHYLTDMNNESKTSPGNIYRISEFLFF
jgi:hypothetical protein